MATCNAHYRRLCICSYPDAHIMASLLPIDLSPYHFRAKSKFCCRTNSVFRMNEWIGESYLKVTDNDAHLHIDDKVILNTFFQVIILLFEWTRFAKCEFRDAWWLSYRMFQNIRKTRVFVNPVFVINLEIRNSRLLLASHYLYDWRSRVATGNLAR